ncbi:MAG TPA: HAD-IC family P-type ATPase, partial [Thermomicrobiales bacterium]|nr:HAD-IC family P-type ATPase [Thermomicrobiales bacterium]
PQGLVLMIAVTYAAAAIRLAGKGALIQQANSIESLSHVDVFCLDKTGTLTTNRLQLDHLTAIGLPQADLEGALADFVASASDQNRTAAAISAAFPGTPRHKRDEIPFSSARKWSAVAFDDPHRQGVYLLGAAEAFGPALAHHPEVERLIAERAKQGLRMLVFGSAAPDSSLRDAQGEPAIPESYQPIGIIALRDELRPEARDTMHQFLAAGVEIKIISGDDPRTVAALAKQAGLPDEIGTVSGVELQAADDEAFAKLVRTATIFGRITPSQKEWIVRVLQEQGHYVAMTGDGVNDVPALKQADLGIAVKSGSGATRAIADLVLLHDSFAVLPDALREGQRIVGGMQDIIKLFLVRSLTVATAVIGAALADATFPITPRHNALLALMTVGIPTFAMAMWARPGRAQARLLRGALPFVAMAVLTISPITLLTFLYALRITDSPEMARTVLTTTAVFCGLMLLPFVEPPTRWWVGGDHLSGDWRPTILALVLLVAYFAMLWVHPFRQMFELEAISLWGLLAIVAVVLIWAWGLRWLWRQRVIERFLGLPADATVIDLD